MEQKKPVKQRMGPDLKALVTTLRSIAPAIEDDPEAQRETLRIHPDKLAAGSAGLAPRAGTGKGMHIASHKA